MEIKGVIFDLWNTLIDPVIEEHTLTRIRDFYNLETEEYRTEVKEPLMTTPLETIYDIQEFLNKNLKFRELTRAEAGELERKIQKDIEVVKVYPEVRQTLKELQKMGLDLALISNAATFHKVPFYDHGLDEGFKYACFSCDVGFVKPAREIYLTTLNRIGLRPEEVIMVGDNKQKDAIVPTSLGMRGVHLDRERRSDFPIRVESLYEIVTLVKNYNSKP